MTVRSKAWVRGHSLARTVVSNAAGGDRYLSVESIVELSGTGLCLG